MKIFNRRSSLASFSPPSFSSLLLASVSCNIFRTEKRATKHLELGGTLARWHAFLVGKWPGKVKNIISSQSDFLAGWQVGGRFSENGSHFLFYNIFVFFIIFFRTEKRATKQLEVGGTLARWHAFLVGKRAKNIILIENAPFFKFS